MSRTVKKPPRKSVINKTQYLTTQVIGDAREASYGVEDETLSLRKSEKGLGAIHQINLKN